MNAIRNIQTWSATHHPRWLVFPRLVLGAILCIKGITFMNNASLLDTLLSGSSLGEHAGALQIIISWANMLGGFFIIIGLWTRVMCFLQLPILVGAIVFINAQRSGFAWESELGLAVLSLLLLILFIIEGSGPVSLDAYFRHNRDSRTQGRNLP